MVDDLICVLGSAYPELKEKKTHIINVIKSEEQSFGITLDRGLILFEELISTLKSKEIPGDSVFKLYDTFGFPKDLNHFAPKNLEVDGRFIKLTFRPIFFKVFFGFKIFCFRIILHEFLINRIKFRIFTF